MHRAFQIVFLRDRIGEKRNEAIVELLGDCAVPFRDCDGSCVEVSAD
jgi:hypothetical protein